ncbi:cache domain-containing protein [Duganella sp. CT11-25]|uniref:cache domain-containing protein n=1 Tax=unclassified Duganella TaxID=2636909 RepID=UPI0039B0A408
MDFKKIAVLGLFACTAIAAQASQEDDARALVKKAIVAIKAQGIEKACADFADPAKGYMAGESYVYVHDMRARMLCNAGSPRTVGKDMIEMKDMDGKYFNKEMLEIAKTKGSGWLEYKWVNPKTKNIQDKKSYVERQEDFIVGSGFYK